MDKKSIVFIFTMVISFFLINQWYSSKYQQELIKKMENEASFGSQKSDQELKSQLEAKEIPLISYFSQSNQNESLGFGVFVNKAFVTLKTKDVQKEISIKKGNNFIPLTLLFRSDDGFCCYAENLDISLDTPFLPQFKQIPVLLSTFEPTQKKYLVGQYENQTISLNAPLAQDAIVFTALGKTILPIGVYRAKSNSLELLSGEPKIREFLSFKFTGLTDNPAQEQFYVIENDYQQIVFSNFGGAIAEINLPFKNEDNKSVVLPVQYDRILEKKYPYESSFPVVKAYTLNHASQMIPYENKIGGYYPLLRRDLVERSGKKGFDLQSRFYACNLIVNGKSLSNQPYRLKRFEKDLIEFEYQDGLRKITKTFRLPKDAKVPYSILLTVKVDGDASGIYLGTGVPEIELIGGSPMPQLQYAESRKNNTIVEKVKLPKATYVDLENKVSYIANTNGYFGIMLASLQEMAQGYVASFIPGDLAPTRLSVIDANRELYPVSKYPGYELLIPLNPDKAVLNYALYAGPIEENILAQADAGIGVLYKNPGFKESQTYYGFFSFISEPFAKFMFILMKMFYAVTGSWGISILLLTVALRVILYPLNNLSVKSQARMQELTPKLTAIQEKYKKDPQRLKDEMLKLYRDHKINPISGFLPQFVQLPFIIGMIDLLKSTFQLRGAEFIPGWINNLSAPDTLLTWNYSLPFIGDSLHLLPILIGIAMLAQSKIGMSKIKQQELNEQQKQQQTMMRVFSFLLPVLFYNFASGVNLYWLFSTLLAIGQQLLTKRIELGKKGS